MTGIAPRKVTLQHLNKIRPCVRTTWAYVDYSDPAVAVIPGTFNRSIFEAPFLSEISDDKQAAANSFLNKTDFIAYDERFFSIIGPEATVTHLQKLTTDNVHEAPCWNPTTRELLFTEWGRPSLQNGTHRWQYLLDVDDNELRNISTVPPTTNLHGCVFFKGSYFGVTDGGSNETGTVIKIDPSTLEKTVILNNFYQQPFAGFNDLEIDRAGNFWITDSWSAWGRDLSPFTPPTLPSVYFVNGTNMRPRVSHITDGNTNGIAIIPDGSTLYLPDSGASEHKPVARKNPYNKREISAFDVSATGGVLSNRRLLNNPISYFYDGIKVSGEGYIVAGAGDGVDFIDPVDGITLGSIRLGGGNNVAVNVALGEHEIFVVGKGGVWHVKNVATKLIRDW
ncbi:uncharacterized protein J7T55_000219 [Diaporthe amygdali]|uniref:uncharacterized protein n=1 Tax=Phomopsis amygdali TaxID=1214568 RepID=UPI0022FF2E99|nr:uncharacterized protein J7T55_000219 [Diaporthe amygdali]KAJ0108253.1 uncharacterized protein J7T55_000219 [Diaporthe amygdali]